MVTPKARPAVITRMWGTVLLVALGIPVLFLLPFFFLGFWPFCVQFPLQDMAKNISALRRLMKEYRGEDEEDDEEDEDEDEDGLHSNGRLP